MPQAEKREIRVFISSTFRDMQAERNYLIKFIFPQLRKLCEQRDVSWHEVDLRWGITDEQFAEGQVLPICLEEIQRCRPYFIGLLGERYGWIPTSIAHELLEREPWLEEYQNRSVTELEILHGVLNNPEMSDRVLFYFRDPEFIKTISPDRLQDFIEVPWRVEIEEYGMDAARKRVDERNKKLQMLKQRIRESRLPLRENYIDTHQLGEWLLQDMRAIIDHLFPEGSQLNSLQKEALEHEAFEANRAELYIGGAHYFSILDKHAESGKYPLIVLGESGSGKSALLANWAIKYRVEHPDEFVLTHFIGATAGSVDWVTMLRRIMIELKVRFNLQGEIPDTPEELRTDFTNWLQKASEKGKTVLILDALNQLEDRQGAQELLWFPKNFPVNFKIVCSTLPGKSLLTIRKQNWPELEVKPLNLEERKQLICNYLAQYAKQLSPLQIKRITEDRQSANPLALRILLDELRQFGIYEKVDDFIERFLKVDSIQEMFDLLLERCESDFEIERPGLVRDALSYIWTSKQGLSETELLDLLGNQGQSIPQRIWSPLYLALEKSFINRRGLLGFYHDYLRQAVEYRYLENEDAKQEVHTYLANYFKSLEGFPIRKIEELPWQLANGKKWERLADLLADWLFFDTTWQYDHLAIQRYWAQLEANSTYRMIDVYRSVIEEHGNNLYHIKNVADLLGDTYYHEEATNLRKYLLGQQRGQINPVELANSLNATGISQKNTGDLEGAMKSYKEAEAIFRNLDMQELLPTVLGNQGNILRRQKKFSEALAIHQEAIQICRKFNLRYGLLTNLNALALVYSDLEKNEKALECLKEQEIICRETGERIGLAAAISNQTYILEKLWLTEPEELLTLCREEVEIYKELGVLPKLEDAMRKQVRYLHRQVRILYNRSFSQKVKRDLEKIIELYDEEENILEELNDVKGVLITQSNRAVVLAALGQKNAILIVEKAYTEAVKRNLIDAKQQIKQNWDLTVSMLDK